MRRVLPVAAVTLGALAACSDSEEPSATIVSMQLTVGDETVTMEADGTVTGSFTVIGGEALEATFFDENGATVTVSGTEFTLALRPADTDRLDYRPLSPFTGVLEGLLAGPTMMDVWVLSTVSGEVAFGPFEVSVTVQP